MEFEIITGVGFYAYVFFNLDLCKRQELCSYSEPVGRRTPKYYSQRRARSYS